MTVTIEQPPVRQSVEVIFYVRENANSPYQGRLVFTPEDYAALSSADLDTMQLAQFSAWKDNNALLAAQAVANADAVPQTITAIQAREAILAAGLKDHVEAAVAASDKATQDAWYGAVTLDRTNVTVIGLATAIGLSSDQLDDLFRQAATL